MKKSPMSSEEFENMLGKDVSTRITLSEPRRYSNDALDEKVLSSKDAFLEMVSSSPTRQKDEFDSDFEDEPKQKRQMETQSLANFLRNTGPDNLEKQSLPPKKKGGIFKFGSKKKKQLEPPSLIFTGVHPKPRHVPLTVAAGYLPDAPAPRHESKNQNIINNQLHIRQQQFETAHNAFKQSNDFAFSNDFVPPKRQNLPDIKTSAQMDEARQIEIPLNRTMRSSDANGHLPQSAGAPTLDETQFGQDVVAPVRNVSVDNPEYSKYQPEHDIYSEEEEEMIEDQGLDDEIERNTEFNAMISNFEVNSTSFYEKSNSRERKSVFFALSNDVAKQDSLKVKSCEQVFNSAKVSGRGARGSFYPREDDASKMEYKARMSSLGAFDQPKLNMDTNSFISSPDPPPRKKKIRHVQIQTRGAMMKDSVAQTANVPESIKDDKDRTIETLLLKNESLERLAEHQSRQLDEIAESLSHMELENSLVKEEIQENRTKFDKLSAQAYRKIKELLMERKMLDLEVSTLRDQVCTFLILQLLALQDAQARNWGM